MIFNSFEYLLFFLIIAVFFYVIPFRFRWIMLLVASYYFYMSWEVSYIVLIVVQTLVAFGVGLIIGKLDDQRSRIAWLATGLSINFGMLFVYKYLNFFTDTINHILEYLVLPANLLPVYDLLLPIGISFFTFQTASYVIDVYRGLPPERHLGLFSLFVTLFPHLIAGPITRAEHILPQLKKEVPFNHARIAGGLRLILLGMFKKVVVADRLAHLVDTVYNNPHNYEGIILIVATIFFAFQIYCDFSGYVDIAIGSAQILGVDFPDNFDSPYQATSISDFWRRWHITLMQWLRDYVYFPLGGSHHGAVRTCCNIFIVFLVSGLWHGANWTFVIWGALNGFYLIVERITKSIRQSITRSMGLDRIPVISHLYAMLCVVVTFSVVCFAWIFFRANSISDAFYIAKHLFSGAHMFSIENLYKLGLDKVDFYFGVFSVGLLELFHFMQKHRNIRFMLAEQPIWLRWSATYFILFVVLLFGYYGENKPFIYFAF